MKVGENPDAILYDPATKRVFTFNGRSQDSTAIDAASGKVLGTIKLDGKPEFAASDAKGEIFVNIEDKSELVAIDPNKLEVKAKWPLAPCTEPSGLSIDRKNRRLFVGCDNKMMAVVDADSGKVLATPAIGEGVDATSVRRRKPGWRFASCGERRADGGERGIAGQVQLPRTWSTQQGARTMALDRKTHNVFVVTAQFGPPPAADGGQSASPATDSSRQLRGAGGGKDEREFSGIRFRSLVRSLCRADETTVYIWGEPCSGSRWWWFWRRASGAYSVLTHEQIVDLLWDHQHSPMVKARFPDLRSRTLSRRMPMRMADRWYRTWATTRSAADISAI